MGVHWLIVSTVAVKWHWIGNGLVEWVSIGKQVYLIRIPLAEWQYSGNGLAMDWSGGY